MIWRMIRLKIITQPAFEMAMRAGLFEQYLTHLFRLISSMPPTSNKAFDSPKKYFAPNNKLLKLQ